MDKYYLLGVIDRLKREIKVHDRKFVNNPVHNNCLPRMEKTLSSLQGELVKIEGIEAQSGTAEIQSVKLENDK